MARNPYAILAQKAAARLTLLKDGRPVLVARAWTGREPGPKKAEGDLCTPEGLFRVCWKNPDSDYHLSLALDYPRPEDAEAALAEGLIDAETRARIAAAARAGDIPPWDTPLGGEIFIHGEGTDRPWTLGCIKVADPVIERLFELVPVGTPVDIRP